MSAGIGPPARFTRSLEQPSRKRPELQATEAIGILPRYGGVTVHDCRASSLSYAHCGHALCGAHLLRELTFIVDAHGYAWAKRMKRLLLDTCHQVASRDHKTLTPHEYKALQKRYRSLLTQGAKELPPIPPPSSTANAGASPNPMPTTSTNACTSTKPAVLLFAANPHVPFTNNRAGAGLAHEKGQEEGVGVLPHPEGTPKRIAESQAICNPWPTRGTIHWWPFRSPSSVMPSKTGGSSYLVALNSGCQATLRD